MTRTEFIRAYAARSHLNAEFAGLGILDHGNRVMVALPCCCGSDYCEGWALVSGDGVLSHLELYAPNDLRDAYRRAVAAADGQREGGS